MVDESRPDEVAAIHSCGICGQCKPAPGTLPDAGTFYCTLPEQPATSFTCYVRSMTLREWYKNGGGRLTQQTASNCAEMVGGFRRLIITELDVLFRLGWQVAAAEREIVTWSHDEFHRVWHPVPFTDIETETEE